MLQPLLLLPCTWTPTSEASSSQLPSRCSRLFTFGRHGDSDVTATSTFVVSGNGIADPSLTLAVRGGASLAVWTPFITPNLFA